MSNWSQLYMGGYGEMITILHRGGVGGALGIPKSDYVICARPLSLKNFFNSWDIREHWNLPFVKTSSMVWQICTPVSSCVQEMYLFGPLSPPGLPAAHLRCLHTLHSGQGDQGAGWQAGRPTKCQGSRLVTQAWKVFLHLANLRPWLFFLVSNPSSPEPLQLHRATSFALKNGQSVWASCCGRARRGSTHKSLIAWLGE